MKADMYLTGISINIILTVITLMIMIPIFLIFNIALWKLFVAVVFEINGFVIMMSFASWKMYKKKEEGEEEI